LIAAKKRAWKNWKNQKRWTVLKEKDWPFSKKRKVYVYGEQTAV
jgi:hypothetical protein